MSTLTASQRDALKASDFAIPGQRAYPIHDEVHARDALSRVAQNGSPDEKARVRAAVQRRYPQISVSGPAGMHPNGLSTPKRSM